MKKIYQEVYGLKGGPQNFNAHELDEKKYHKKHKDPSWDAGEVF